MAGDIAQRIDATAEAGAATPQERGGPPDSELCARRVGGQRPAAAGAAAADVAAVYGAAADRISGVDHPVTGGDTVSLPDLELSFDVVALPGHTLNHLGYIGDDVALVGDTLFAGSVGRTDLPGGSTETLRMVDALQFHDKHGRVCPANWQAGEEGMEESKQGVVDYLSKFSKKPKAGGARR